MKPTMSTARMMRVFLSMAAAGLVFGEAWKALLAAHGGLGIVIKPEADGVFGGRAHGSGCGRSARAAH
jgi:hypothetical protein